MTDTKKGDGFPKVETVQDAKNRRKTAAGAEPDEPSGDRMIFRVKGKEYPFPKEFTGRELVEIQRETGVRGAEIDAALEAGDALVLLSILAVSMRRAGEDPDLDELLDIPLGVDGGILVEEETADPPADAGDEPAAVGASSTRARGGRRS